MLFGTRQRLNNNESPEVHLDGKAVNRVTSSKYIGVILDECLFFNKHISYVKSKISRRLGLLTRLRGCLTMDAANRIYSSMISPIFHYCDTSFCHLGTSNSLVLDRLQRRAARIVYNFRQDLDTDTMLARLRWLALNKCREMHCVLLVNKCLSGVVPQYLSSYFISRSDSNQTLRNTISFSTDLVIPKIKLEVARKSFYYQGAYLYNKLDA